MKRIRATKNLAIVIVTALVISGCDLIFPQPELPVMESPSGNLVVANDSGYDLGLFVDGALVSGVPASRSQIVVRVDVAGTQEEKELRLYRADKIEGQKEPGPDGLYRSWNVVLAANTSLATRRTWHIGPDTTESTSSSGTLTLRYGSGTENFVRVYAGGVSGSKIAVLSAQAGDAVVGMDYGTYELTYEYVYDDGQGTGATVVGTLDRESVMGNRVPIYVVLNTIQQNHTKQVPHYEAGNVALPTPYGTLSVTNMSASPITIWVNGKLIEEVAYLGDGSRDNASTIASSTTTDYVIAAGTHHVKASSITGTTLVEFSVDVAEDETYGWTVTAP